MVMSYRLPKIADQASAPPSVASESSDEQQDGPPGVDRVKAVRLRNLFLLANVAAWALIIIAIRQLFF
jgi:hypothetical protein